MTERPPPAAGERAVPFYCPYCGEEDLRPEGPQGGRWSCRSCRRVWRLHFDGFTTGTAN